MRVIGRLLAHQVLIQRHLGATAHYQQLSSDQKALLEELQRQYHELVQTIPSEVQYTGEIIGTHTADSQRRALWEQMSGDEDMVYLEQGAYEYRTLLPARDNCLQCHARWDSSVQQGSVRPLGLARIVISTSAIDDRVQVNRAILISTAIVTTLLLMAGSYLIVRYVVVKPVQHLKEVSDAISAGQLNIRSEIQTGDEFEDLSHAFNRMLRTLVSMQEQLRKVNADLDRKVDQLAQANMALYQSNQLMSDFLATVSHELRTPLNSIIGFSDLLLSGDVPPDKQAKWITNIKESGQRLLRLINDILDLAKIEAGRMQIHVEELSFHDISEGLVNMFRPLAEKKNIEITCEVDADLPLLKQDGNKIQQILWNLMSNAVKYTPEGGRIVLRARRIGETVEMSVQDTGVGIAPEDQEVIFDKFRQVGRVLTRDHEGTGLGLSIVKELTRLLGGNISLQSELGKGSTFTVTLPIEFTEQTKQDYLHSADGLKTSLPRQPAPIFAKSKEAHPSQNV
ncbi:MAG: histidine kinase [Gemmataceae bacterium]